VIRQRTLGGSGTRLRLCLVAAVVVGVSLAVAGSAAQVNAGNAALSGVTVRTLAQGPVKNLPNAKIFVNILEFRQVPGAAFGPHAHVPGFVYTLRGTATISFPAAATRSVKAGEATFIPGLAVHTHNNVDGRFGAGAIAGGLIVVVILLCAATWLRGGSRGVTVGALSVLLIAGAVFVLSGATSNDIYFIAVRPDSQRGQPMPRPDGRVAFSSPAVDPVLAGPYVETLTAIAVPPGARYDAVDVRGPELIIGLEGTAEVQLGGESRQVGGGEAALAQAGKTLAILNRGSGTVRLLAFAVTPLLAAPTT